MVHWTYQGEGDMFKKTVGVVVLLGVFVTWGAVAQVGAKKKASDPRVEKLLKSMGVTYIIDNDGDFKMTNDVGGGRTQNVFVLSATVNLSGLEIRQVASPAYQFKRPMSAELANRLLEHNATVKLGAWQTQKAGEEYVAIFAAQIAAETDSATLLTTIQAVTETADALEKELTEKDAF